MLTVRRLTAEEARHVPLMNDAVLIGDETFLRIGATGFRLSYVPLGKAEWRSFPYAHDEALHDLAEAEGAAVYGAFREERLAGLAAVACRLNGWAELCDVRVNAADRRQGVASALIAACEDFAHRRGMHGLRVTASEQNAVLCQFLEHNGFTLQGLDRKALIHTPAEKDKPLMRRACALFFYRDTEKG